MTNSPAYARIVSTITNSAGDRTNRAIAAWDERRRRIPGWSTAAHALFFSAVAEALRPQFKALVCGVYHGMDLSLLEWAARDARTTLDLTGVDLFSDGACADWDEGQRARGTWEANGFGPPPSTEAAQRNAPTARLVKANSIEFMQSSPQLFDFIYLDTSHDYETVAREIPAAKRILAPGGVLAGDDYYNPGSGWGVDRAVCELCPHHVALWNRIWLAT